MVSWVGQLDSGYFIAWLASWGWLTHEFTNPPSPYTTAPGLRNCTNTDRKRLVVLLNSVAVAQEQATIDGTKSKQIRARRLWCEFLPSIGNRCYVFLDGFPQWQRQIILAALAKSVRDAEYSPKMERLVTSSVQDTVGETSQVFRSTDRKDPCLDNNGTTWHLLQ